MSARDSVRTERKSTRNSFSKSAGQRHLRCSTCDGEVKKACTEPDQGVRREPGGSPHKDRSLPEQIAELRLVAGEHGAEVPLAQMARYQFAQNVAEVGGQSEVAAFVELVFRQARPFAVDFAAAHGAAECQH